MIETINNEYVEIMEKRMNEFALEKKKELESKGVSVIPKLFKQSYVEEMISTARRLSAENPNKSGFSGIELKETCFCKFATSDFVLKLCNLIIKDRGIEFKSEDVRPVLGIGTPPEYKNKMLHFDSVYLTLAIPVVMPDSNRLDCGPFRIWPNVRSFSKNKIKNKVFWRLMRTPWIRDRFKHFDIKFVPGNAYLFYGFRSWHGVGELGSDLIRMNNLIHVGEVWM